MNPTVNAKAEGIPFPFAAELMELSMALAFAAARGPETETFTFCPDSHLLPTSLAKNSSFPVSSSVNVYEAPDAYPTKIAPSSSQVPVG